MQEDLVFETEQIRVNTLDDVTTNNNYGSSVIPNTSNKFKTYKTKLNNNSNLYKVRFISINNQYANSELNLTENYLLAVAVTHRHEQIDQTQRGKTAKLLRFFQEKHGLAFARGLYRRGNARKHGEQKIKYNFRFSSHR